MARALERTSGPVVLAGHAYGGAVIGAIRDERVYRDEPHAEAPKLIPDKHGFIWMPADGLSRAVAHKASNDDTRIMAAVQRPISVQCIQETAPAPGWKTKPSWFLFAEEDRMINPKTQEFMAARMSAKVRSGRVDQSQMYTATNLVVDVILEAARESRRVSPR